MLRLLRFLKPYRSMVALIVVLTFFQSMAQLYLPTLMSEIVDIGIVQGNIPYILKIGAWMLLVAIGGTVATVWAGFLSAQAASGFGKDVRSQVFGRVEHFSLHDFNEVGVASLITRTTNDITQMQMLVTMFLRMFIGAPIMAMGGIAMAIYKDATLALVIVVAIPILSLAIFGIARQSVPLFQTLQRKLDRLNLVLRENLSGIRVVRAFNRIAHEQRRFREANQELTETAIRVNRILASLMPVMMLVLNYTTIAIIWFGGIRIDHGDMQVGDLMAFLQYVMQIMFSFIMLSMLFVMIPRASASATRVNEVLDIMPENKVALNRIPDQGFDSDVTLKPNVGPRFRGQLEFTNVSFRYPGAEQPVLSGISFTARPGEVTAIIGGTGSGKSTLLNLIPRFYDVETGSIRIDGEEIQTIPHPLLRSLIGFVPQKAVLFTGSIADNIRYGKENASVTEIEHAAETAQMEEFIRGLSDGFGAKIAQGGTNLSGGQKQRLAIARALVRRPSIYLFDDSFSALDFKTDARLRAALKKETQDATVIIVAQRVSTVMDADQILVLDEGKIIGIGKHKELMETCQAYREIVSSQLSEGVSA